MGVTPLLVTWCTKLANENINFMTKQWIWRNLRTRWIIEIFFWIAILKFGRIWRLFYRISNSYIQATDQRLRYIADYILNNYFDSDAAFPTNIGSDFKPRTMRMKMFFSHEPDYRIVLVNPTRAAPVRSRGPTIEGST